MTPAQRERRARRSIGMDPPRTTLGTIMVVGLLVLGLVILLVAETTTGGHCLPIEAVP